MKILVIFTGGTIGSTMSDGYVSTDSDKPYRLIELYRKQSDIDVELDTVSPYEELSENNTCINMMQLGRCVKDNLDKDYDGIIVTHGTDTLQYTAAALGYMTGDESIPIVMVSSNYVLEDERANGLDNFYYAVAFISQHLGKGVFVSYRNAGDRPKIHRATRLMEHLPYTDEVYSVCDRYFGAFEDNQFIYNGLYNSSRKYKEDQMEPFEPMESEWSSDIMVIRPYPGMKYDIPADNVKAVLHYTYHSGTMCSKTPDIQQFADNIRERNIPVYIVGNGAGADYESVKIYESLGFKVLPIASPLAMYIKLWLCSVNGRDIIESMKCQLSDDYCRTF